MTHQNITKSAGGIVINTDGQVLVVSQHGNSWSLPKGHIEDNEDVLAAAKREIEEESGISELVLLKDLGSYTRYRIGPPGTPEDKSELKTIFLFLFTTTQTHLNPSDPHNPEARWVDIDAVSELLTHPKDKDYFLSVIPTIKNAL